MNLPGPGRFGVVFWGRNRAAHVGLVNRSIRRQGHATGLRGRPTVRSGAGIWFNKSVILNRVVPPRCRAYCRGLRHQKASPTKPAPRTTGPLET